MHFSEEKKITTAATTRLDDQGYFKEEKAAIRKEGEPVLGHVEEIDYMDVSPSQIISVATSLIPFFGTQ